jgi:hypothetical protein
MYERVWTRLLIVFLTHPGVLIPIPVEGLFSWVRGLFQASAVLLMNSFAVGKWKQIAEMVYWILLLVMAYIQVAIALAKAKT